MKKNIILLLVFGLLTSLQIDAQNVKKAMRNIDKDVSQALAVIPIDHDKLQLALAELDKTFTIDEAKTDPVMWNNRGDIYNSIADAEMKALLLDESYEIQYPEAPSQARTFFKEAISLSTKAGHTSDALKGLLQTEGHLNNLGITYFSSGDYLAAYKKFNEALNLYKFLSENSSPSRLDNDEERASHIFYTSACGFYGKAGQELIPLFKELMSMNYEDALVYQALFELKEEKGDSDALTYLEKGRELFPENTGLLFAEINYYLRNQKLDILIDKLKAAIEAEPTNLSVYATLGNVFDQLMMKSRGAGELEQAQEYFDQALVYYNAGLGIDENNFELNYSVGALYYNKAASMVEDLNKLSDDYSREGTRKFNALKAEMDRFFDQSLPYFLKAESVSPTDMNTLIALREIYARKGEIEKSDSYRTKIENR
jgi:tetratricopeptide (TPR) repeat protein